MAAACKHFEGLTPVRRGSAGCEECVKMGDTWVHLRECLLCGTCGLLRFIPEQARDEAFRGHRAPGDAFGAAGGALGMVLCG